MSLSHLKTAYGLAKFPPRSIAFMTAKHNGGGFSVASFKGRQSGGGAGKAMGGREHRNVVAVITKALGSQNFPFVSDLDRMLL